MSGLMYRAKMRLAHWFGFCWPQHTSIEGPDSGLVWCHWCGMRGRKPSTAPAMRDSMLRDINDRLNVPWAPSVPVGEPAETTEETP